MKAPVEFNPLGELPAGWSWQPLQNLTANPKQDVVDGPFGSDLKASEYVAAGVPIARLQNIDRNAFVTKNIRYLTHEKAADLSRHEFRPNDILITKLGDPLGKACIVPASIGRGVIVADLVRVRPDESRVDRQYLTYAINSPSIIKQFELHTKGTTRPRVNLSVLRQLPIPVAPREVQDEIVAELEKQFSRLDEAVANLQRVKANLKRYKASVLNDAVEGRLVESDSPAALVKLGSVANLIDPQPSHRTPPTHPDGVPYIGIGDVLENGKLDFQNSRKVSPTVLEEHRARYTLRIGDFIFGKIGTLGRPTLLMPPFTYTLSANVVLVQADGVRLLPEYALIFMDSPKLLNMISREAKATTQAAYGIKRMRDLEINLPPVEQQRKIVAEVDRHLSIIREVEAEVDANLQRARALRQSTLSSVFSGG